jgi:hypothetical protein
VNVFAKLVERWKSRQSAIDNTISQAEPGPAYPEQIAVIEPPRIGPGRPHPDLLPEQVWGSNHRAIPSRQDCNRLRISVCERDIGLAEIAASLTLCAASSAK